MRKVQANSTGTLAVANPEAASNMMPISKFLTNRITLVFSYLSVTWPAVALNSKNGKINNAPITSPAMAGCIQLMLNWYVTITVKANLNKLSLAAPANCVQKKGAKRRWLSSANWLGWSCAWLGSVLCGIADIVLLYF